MFDHHKFESAHLGEPASLPAYDGPNTPEHPKG